MEITEDELKQYAGYFDGFDLSGCISDRESQQLFVTIMADIDDILGAYVLVSSPLALSAGCGAIVNAMINKRQDMNNQQKMAITKAVAYSIVKSAEKDYAQ